MQARGLALLHVLSQVIQGAQAGSHPPLSQVLPPAIITAAVAYPCANTVGLNGLERAPPQLSSEEAGTAAVGGSSSKGPDSRRGSSSQQATATHLLAGRSPVPSQTAAATGSSKPAGTYTSPHVSASRAGAEATPQQPPATTPAASRAHAHTSATASARTPQGPASLAGPRASPHATTTTAAAAGGGATAAEPLSRAGWWGPAAARGLQGAGMTAPGPAQPTAIEVTAHGRPLPKAEAIASDSPAELWVPPAGVQLSLHAAQRGPGCVQKQGDIICVQMGLGTSIYI